MFSLKHPFIDQVLDPLSVVLGLIALIPIFWTWFDLVWGRKRRHRLWLEQARSTRGRLPAVLIVDLLAGKEIRAAVMRFLTQQEALARIPEERIITVFRNADLTLQDMAGLARDIQDAAAQVLRLGADELHVFLAGPLCASALVGAELANLSCRVFLYQNDRGSGGYVNFGPLRHPRF